MSELRAKKKTAAVVDSLEVFLLNMFGSKDVEALRRLFVMKVILSQLFIYSREEEKEKEPFYLNYCEHAFL